ncbi:hypothetical protein [Streptomyces sp. NPDC088910]|uniref:hypothetical protein n=1 Tax=Streptomyces sp. NPDC088910 TaxID=3365911 RepID=UPI0037F9E2C0
MVKPLLTIAGFAAVILIVLGVSAAIKGNGALAVIPLFFGIGMIGAIAWISHRASAAGNK